MPQLDLASYPSQLFWLAVTFFLLYAMIARYVLPSIGRVLRTRQDRIGADLDEAERLKNDAEALRNQYDASLRKSRGKANDTIAQAVAKAQEAAQARHAELDAVLAEKFAAAEQTIQAARKSANDAFVPVAASLTQQIVRKLARVDVSQSASKNAVDALMKGSKS